MTNETTNEQKAAMNTLGRSSMPTFPTKWLRPRMTAVAVAKARAAATSRCRRLPRGLQERVTMPSTVRRVPAAIAAVSRSPRKRMERVAANRGAVAANVEVIVAPARL